MQHRAAFVANLQQERQVASLQLSERDHANPALVGICGRTNIHDHGLTSARENCAILRWSRVSCGHHFVYIRMFAAVFGGPEGRTKMRTTQDAEYVVSFFYWQSQSVRRRHPI